MEVLVTGADGFIGQHLCRRLAKSHRVWAVSRRMGGEPIDNVERVQADLTAADFERSLPRRVDAVIAAAQSRRYREFPDGARDMFEVNVRSLERLLEWSRSGGVSRFVYLSSANVYALASSAINEDAELRPTTYYATTKRIAEMLVSAYGSRVNATVLRLFTPFGPGQIGALIPQLIDRLRNHRTVTLHGSGGLKLAPIFVADACEAITRLLVEASWPAGSTTLNLGGGQAMDVRDIARALGHAMRVEPTFERESDSDPGGWVPDCSRLIARIGRPDVTPLENAFRETVDACIHAVKP